MNKLKTLALAVGIVAAVSACSPEQTQKWLDWWEDDPEAAVAWAENECGSLCTDDWDQDGRVEPDAQQDDGWTDVTTEDTIFDTPDEEGGEDTGGVYEPWISLAECESGGNWATDTGNGYYGGLQFAWGSWEAAGGSGNPAHASPSEQVMRGEILQDMQGWNAWPTCARQIGLI